MMYRGSCSGFGFLGAMNTVYYRLQRDKRLSKLCVFSDRFQ